MGVLKNLLHSSPPTSEVIVNTVQKLKFQSVKLENVTFRLRNRDKVLFDACITEIGNKRKERAVICASELAEVRKLFKIVTQCQLALQRVTLRLETIKELGSVLADLGPTLGALRGLTGYLGNIMPDIASELGKVNDSITETLAMSKFDSTQSVTPYEVGSPAGEEILKEVSNLIEGQLTKKLPEPPAPVSVEKKEVIEEKKEMVALTASCSETRVQKDTDQYFSIKDVETHEVSFTIQRSSLEDDVLEYVKKCNGELDVNQCAVNLKIASPEVIKTLESLGEKGKIKILR